MFKKIMLLCLILLVQTSYTKELDIKNEQTINDNHQSSKIINQITGVYKKRSIIRKEAEADLFAEDILEIVKVNDDTIYFRIHSNSYAGHICGLYGTAIYVEDDIFLYEYKSDPKYLEDHPGCKLAIKITEKDVEFIDGYAGSNQCRDYNCGVNASLDSLSFKRSMRRPIKYMKRLKDSIQYKQSIEELKK